MKPLILVSVLFTLTACGKYSVRNIDNPTPRPDYGGWLKLDGSTLTNLEGRRALLECGDPAPGMNRFIEEKVLGISDTDESIKFTFMVKGCMERSGLQRLQGWGTLTEDCKLQHRYATFPACQPDATFPTRSAQRRLNSWYCKIKTDREYCHQYGLNPSACDDPTKDYNNPPPECRP